MMIKVGFQRQTSRAALLALLVAASVAGPLTAGQDDATVIVLKIARVHTVAGEPLDGGMVIVRDGRIETVGRDLEIPAQARVIELTDGVLTPGLIDACCTVDTEIPQAAYSRVYAPEPSSLWRRMADYHQVAHEHRDHVCGSVCGGAPPFSLTDEYAPATSRGLTWAEHSSEVTPHRFVADSLNLLSNDFVRLMKGGVTTVYVSPDSANVISSRGAIVKTAGPLDQRFVRRAGAVKATMGSDPSRRGRYNRMPPGRGRGLPSFHTRRPTTRMGVEWVFRKALYDARRSRDGLEPYGADTPPPQAIPVLQQILDGEIPLRIQARMQNDIFSALRLANEFGVKFVLEEATEAYRCLPQLQAANVPIIFGPLYMTPTGWRRTTGEANRPRLDTPKQLADAGIPFALTAQELRDEEGLVRQGMYAVRNGLPTDATLRALTATPAKLLGLPDQVGVITAGAIADLVVWSAEPFTAQSRPLLVMIDGRIVYQE